MHPFSDDILVAYATGEMSQEEAATFERRLRDHPDEAAAVVRIQEIQATFRSDTSEAPSDDALRRTRSAMARVQRHLLADWISQARRVLAQLVFDSRAQPALAGYRGISSTFQLSYDSEQARLDLRVTPPASDPAPWKVMGRVRAKGETPIGRVLLLTQGHDEATTTSAVDESGRFTIETLPGEYDLAVQVGERMLVAPAISLT